VKTIKVTDLIEKANLFLSSPDPASADQLVRRERRKAVHAFTENFLHDAKVYAGFGYQRPYRAPEVDPTYDDSRTFFYTHKKLQSLPIDKKRA
jgi:hypothetical protein